MAWVGPMIKFQLWNLFRLIFAGFRAIGWLFRCIPCRRSKNRRPDAYKGTVQRMSIWARFKVDLVLQPSGSDNFLMVHDSWVDPEYVLDDTVSLYYMTKDEAVFVECPPEITPWRSRSAPFLRQAQFQHAKNVLIMPMHVFHRLAKDMADPKVLFVSNTARCGSTLLTQVFEETGRSVTLSEPDCMNALSVVDGQVPKEEYDRIIRDSVRVLCKPHKAVPDCLIYVIKLTSPTMLYVPYLMEKFPNSMSVFMYRDGLPMCKSLDRAGYQMPLLDMLLYMGRNSVKMTQKIVKQMGLPPENFAVKAESRIFLASIVWASAIQLYRKQRAQGINVAGVSYEDIVADPTYAFTQIFEFCGMPHELIDTAVATGMSKDSQRSSPLSRDKLSQYAAEEYTDRIKALCDEKTSAKFNLPKLDEPCILEGTITHKPTAGAEDVKHVVPDVNENDEVETNDEDD